MASVICLDLPLDVLRIVVVSDVGSGERRCVLLVLHHPHVERPILGEEKTPLRHMDLMAGDSQIEEEAVDLRYAVALQRDLQIVQITPNGQKGSVLDVWLEPVRSSGYSFRIPIYSYD